MLKILDIFNASRYTVPRRDKIDEEIEMLKKEIKENLSLHRQSETTIRNSIKEKIGDVFQTFILGKSSFGL